MKTRKKAVRYTIGACTVVLGSFILAACSSNSGQSGSANSTNTKFEVATDRWSQWGTTFENFPNKLAKQAGISVKWDVYVDSTWQTKKSTVIASGNLPDAFIGNNVFTDQEIAQNIADFVPLNQYINSTDMPNLTKMLAANPSVKAAITEPDGKIYSLPKIAPMRPTVSNQLFINQKWLTQLGLQMPTTYDQLVNVLKQFKAKIPNAIPYSNGNGTADVFSYILPFNNRVGAPGTDYMSLNNGKPVWLYNTDNFKTGIEAMHTAYTEGLIDPQLFTDTVTQAQAKATAKTEIVGMANGWTADAIFGANAKDYAPLSAIKGPDGIGYVQSDPEHFNQSRNEVLVTTHATNVKALMKWLDSFYTPDASIQNFYGEFGVGTQKTSTGYEVLPPQGNNSADTLAWINSLRDFGPKTWNPSLNSTVAYQDQTNGDAIKLKLDSQFKQYVLPAFPAVTYTSSELNQMATIYNQIYAYAQQETALWVTKGGIEKDWSSYQSKLNTVGYQTFMKIQQDAFNRYEKALNK